MTLCVPDSEICVIRVPEVRLQRQSMAVSGPDTLSRELLLVMQFWALATAA